MVAVELPASFAGSFRRVVIRLLLGFLAVHAASRRAL